jgi:hypothetical protein
MFHFPPKVFNERVAVFVDSFFEEMARLYRAQGWPWEEPKRSEGRWKHADFNVRVATRYKDSAAHVIELKAANLPGVAAVDEARKATLRTEHRFRIELPRSYPGNLGDIVVSARTALYHPRLNPGGTGPACIYVNGEIDRVLWSIVRHILFDPEYVQPPGLYPGRDRGMNILAMGWYETDPRGIHKRLLDRWAEAHGSKEYVVATKSRGGVEIRST